MASLQFDIIIVGAGVVGAAAAAALGRAGYRILVIERDLSTPERIVGELLQPGGVYALRDLGLEDCIEGIDGVDVQGYVVVDGKRQIRINYPASEGRLASGKSFHHGKFVAKLRDAARSSPNVTMVEATAQELLWDHAGTAVTGVAFTPRTSTGSKQPEQAVATLTLVADGCFSSLRKHIHPRCARPQPAIATPSYFYGLVMRDCELLHPGYGHVVLAEPSTVLMYQIATGEVRVLVDVPVGVRRFKSQAEIKEYMRQSILPQLPLSIQPSFATAVDAQTIRSMPNQQLSSSPLRQQGVVMLGDAANMRHPLTGGGMTVGLRDVVELCRLLSPATGPRLGQRILELGRLQSRRKRHAAPINLLAQSLYVVLAAPRNNRSMRIIREGILCYLGSCSTGVQLSIGLISGITRSPLAFLLNSIAVIAYAVLVHVYSQSLWCLPVTLHEALSAAVELLTTLGPMVVGELFD
ncbi:squalene epoxidase-domain-containing protein [Polychytrium aggregatum]|uniref:squalene epoxidase-domain-containing protein n=1 Tax=Polychytrium aggregatum TaxID=110093 RepID=UPI0022FED8FD|nr:squalene epoxidase-domain-containing protein [Polychytrium aggregatum]KAI9199530.1 squalene epoxidase-domain-containing protein [Polychytrium aggregatum]